jgi:predicted TIM-barrel fold metal-dependent hydrolase
MRHAETSRRGLLKTFAAATAVGLPTCALWPETPANLRRIDVHHHYDMPGGRGVLGSWTATRALDEMDKHGIETSIISRTSGETEEGGEKGRAFARRSNEFAAKVVSDHPKRFGFFANIAYSDPDGAMKELEYAYETLHADGVSLLSSIGDKWPGDRAFDPVFDELNRRKAILFLHPFTSKCCRTLIPGGEGSVERDFDTTRAVTNLLYSGTLSRLPDIRYIINHSGADVPVMAGRIKDRVPGFSTFGGTPLSNHEGRTEKIPHGVFYELTKSSDSELR